RDRLGRRGPGRSRGARRVLTRRDDRPRSEPALRRSGDDGDEDLRTADGVAELDLPAAERSRREGCVEGVWAAGKTRVRLEEDVEDTMISAEKIPNNVNLSGNKRLQRALEHWQPKYIQWWRDMGPQGFQDYHQVYVRTAVSVDPEGWAHFEYVKLPEYRWGI